MKTYTLQCGCAFECDDNSARWVISCNLHAAAEQMLEALKDVEWCGDYPHDPCLWCDGYKKKGHAPGCPRQAAIAAADKKE